MDLRLTLHQNITRSIAIRLNAKTTNMIFTKLLETISSLERPNGEVWFRGQSDASWILTPRLLRSPNGVAQEQNILARFRTRAMGMLPSHPADNDPARWMFLMQHHGVPTRLLDWTESALVALYFAVSGSPDCDGAFYMLLPMDLNESQIAKPILFSPYSEEIHKMLMASFKGSDISVAVFAMLAYASNDRISRQRGNFTIHGSSTDLRTFNNSPWLTTLKIPAASKPEIREQLAYFGVTQASLFNDLDSLASELREQHGIN
jgi:hypothetical protein